MRYKLVDINWIAHTDPEFFNALKNNYGLSLAAKPTQDKKAKAAEKAGKEHFDVPLTLALAGYISYMVSCLKLYSVVFSLELV